MAVKLRQFGGISTGPNIWLSLNDGALLTVEWDQVVLRILGSQPYVFPRESITRLSRFRFVFSAGLRIEHRIPEYPPFVVFWSFDSFDYEDLKKLLQLMGYPIVDNKRNIKN